MPPRVSVIIPTHNPGRDRLRRCLAALVGQHTQETWECLIVDNASTPAVNPADYADHAPTCARFIPEPQLGLTAARIRGIREASGEFLIFADDDNVLAPTYLETVATIFANNPRLGAIGGKSIPEFESPPPAWTEQFWGLLALRDLGPAPIVSAGLRRSGAPRNEYPACAPIGAGMAIRREVAERWTGTCDGGLTDRRGTRLSSGGDNDIVFSVMKQGFEVGYFPELTLRHLIPPTRLAPEYLARLNRGIQKSWMQVLSLHDANPWDPIPAWSLPLRRAKSWLSYTAWKSPAHHIRWQGACGHFEGRLKASAANRRVS